MKKLFLNFLLLTVLCFSLCACTSDPFVVFSTQNPKRGLKKEQLGTYFKKGDRVYYALIAPKGFKGDLIKIQLIKKDPKSEFWGYTNLRNKTVPTEGKNYLSDYFVLEETGIYVLSAYEVINLSKPIATGAFRVE